MADAEVAHEIARLEAQIAREQARADDLKHAIRVARHIGIAVGLVMAQSHATYDRAVSQLEEVARQTSRNLFDIAETVIAAGSLN